MLEDVKTQKKYIVKYSFWNEGKLYSDYEEFYDEECTDNFIKSIKQIYPSITISTIELDSSYFH